MNKILTFIGAGNMARGLLIGLINDNSPFTLRVVDPDQSQLDSIRQHWPSVEVYAEAGEAIKAADVVLLAVKPQIMQPVCESLREAIQQESAVVISVAAGVREASINAWLGGGVPVVRCMPNTPALVQAAATGLYANPHVQAEQRTLAENILRAVGIAHWFDTEQSLDTVTAVSGSGPAYFFLLMESMQNTAQSMGMSLQEARLFVSQTAFGAAKLALESTDDVSELRSRVTSKGGTTEAAINTMLANDLPQAVEKGMLAAKMRSEELSLITKDEKS